MSLFDHIKGDREGLPAPPPRSRQEEATCYQTVRVHVASKEDGDDFLRLLGLNPQITGDSFWWPPVGEATTAIGLVGYLRRKKT